jgi:gliding motility-associated-like protein
MDRRFIALFYIAMNLFTTDKPSSRHRLLLKSAIGLLLFLSSRLGFAQLDTEFWFAPPELTQSTNEGAPRDRPIQLVISTLEKAGTVRILQPADLTFEPIVLNMAANSTRIVDLSPFIDRIESKPENTILKTGIFIQSTASISAYYEIRSVNNTDIFTLKGANANGRLFFTPFQTHWHNSLANGNVVYNPTTYASFDIVATDDTTHVTITPTKPLVGHPAGVPFSITLNRGQVYSCRAADRFGYNHPAGSKIESDKDIAVTVKDDMLQFNPPAAGADIAGDQIIPVDYIGTDYVLVRGGLSGNNDRVYFTATEDNTLIRVNGVAIPVDTLNQGEQYELVMADPTYFVKASKKVYAWHISGIADQVGGALIPALSCTGTNQIGFARTNSATYVVNVITKESAKNNFTLNGDPTLVPGSAFQPIQGSNGWVYARITFSTSQVPAGTTLLLKNSSNELFHVGVSNYAVGVGSNYGYFSNFSRLNLGTSKQLCIGDTANLDAGPAKTSYLWNTGATTRFLETTVPGKYWVNTLSGSQCPKSDTVVVRFYSPTFNIGPDDTICIGETKLIQPNGVFTFTWQDGSTGNTFLANQPGTYWAQVADFQGCTTRDSLIIFEAPKPATPIASGSDTVCKGQIITLTMDALAGLDYEWLDPVNQVIPGKTIQVNTSTQSPGQYKAFVKRGSCISLPDSALIGIVDNPNVNLGKDTVFCGLTGSVVLDPGLHKSGQSYLWSNSSTDTSLTVTQGGSYFVRVENESGCFSLDTIEVVFQGPAQPTVFFGSDIWCQNENAVFGVQNTPNYVYQWSGPNGFSFTGSSLSFSNIQPSQSGNYTVTPFLNGCSGSDTSRFITVGTSPQITLGQDIVSCLAVTFILDPISNGDGLTYLWNDNSTDSNLVVTSSGTYSVAVSNGQCTSRDTMVVQTGVGPTSVLFTGLSSFCQNSLATFGVTAQPDETYNWTGPNNFTFTGPDISIPGIQASQGGTYTVVPIKDGCQGTPFTRIITVRPAPIANLGPDLSICPSGTLTLDPTPNGGEENFYIWNDGSADSILVVNGAGTYHVEVTDGICSSSDTIIISAGQAPQPITISGITQYCEGGSLILSVEEQIGATYSWTGPSGFTASSNSITIPSLSLAQSGKYKIGYQVNGCPGTPDSVLVSVFPTPNVNLGSDQLICQGSSATLQTGIVGSGFSYLWSTGSTDSIIQVNAAGNYYVAVSSGGGLCTGTDTVQVSFGNPPSAVTFQGVTDYCSGSPATFGVVAQTGITYNWTGPNGFIFSGATIQIPSIQVVQAGTYSVIPFLGTCAGDTFQVEVSISPGPVINLGPDQEICGFTPVTLNAGNGQPGFTFLWNTGNTDSTLTVNQTGTYFVTVSSPGCSKSDTISMTFKPTPLPVTIEGDPNHCAGETLELQLQGIQTGAIYNWVGPNGFTAQGSSVSIPSISILNGGTYTVTPSLDGCDGEETFISIAVNPAPTANLGLDIESCLGTTFILDPVPASFGLTFLWNTGSTDSSILVTQSGQYIVKVSNSFDCSISDTINVNFFPIPVNTAFTGDTLYCSGQSGSFGIPVAGNLTATWTGPNGFSATGNTINLNNVNPSQSGYYVVYPRIGSCFGTPDSVLVRITDSPVVNLGPDSNFCGQSSYLLSVENPQNFEVLWNTTAVTNSILVSASGKYFVTVSTGACSVTDTVNLEFNSIPSTPILNSGTLSVCEGVAAAFSLTPQEEVEYVWSGPGGFSAIGANILVPGLASGQGTYVVKGIRKGCESAIATAELVVKPIPLVQTNAPQSVCKGKQALVQATFSSGASILWSDFSNQPTANFGPGTNWVTATLNGCSAADTFLIENSGPKAAFMIGPDTQAIVYQKVLFIDQSTPGASPIANWEWKLGYSQIQTTQNAEFTYLIDGPVVVQLKIVDNVGCADTLRKTLDVRQQTTWFIPSLFSPNGDGSNETFSIIEMDKYPGSSLTIFDRWGKEQFSSSDYKNDWKGDDLQEGVYFYVVKRSDGQTFNGYILLKR